MSISINKVQSDLYTALAKCQVRGLVHSATWLAELLLSTQRKPSISDSVVEAEVSPGSLIADQYNGLSYENFSKYNLAKCYFDTQEYARCAHLLASIPKQDSHPLIDFLHFYSRYMSIEKHITDDSITNMDASNYAKCGSALPSEIYRNDLSGLKSDMEQRFCNVEDVQDKSLDAFLSSTVDVYTAYVYALVQIRLGFQSVALKTLVHIVKKDPLLWPAWAELIKLFEDREKLDRLFPPSSPSDSANWMLEFFRAKVGHFARPVFLLACVALTFSPITRPFYTYRSQSVRSLHLPLCQTADFTIVSIFKLTLLTLMKGSVIWTLL